MRNHFSSTFPGRRTRLFLTAAFCGGISAGFAFGDWYVATNAQHTFDGQSWATAFTNVQQALDAAASNDEILLAGQTFSLTNQLVWTNAGVTVRGGFDTNTGDHDPEQWPTVIKRSGSSGNHRILYIDGSDNSTLEHVTISGGNVEQDSGGGLRIHNSQSVLLSGCMIESNTVNEILAARGIGDGAGLYAESSSVSLSNCLVRANVARNSGWWPTSYTRGGGIWSDGELTLRNCSILDNTAQNIDVIGYAGGGGVYFAGTSLTVSNVVFSGNHVPIGSRNDATVSRKGDGLFLAAGTATLADVMMVYNHGDGFYLDGDSAELANVLSADNAARGIFVQGGSVTLNNITVSDNEDCGIENDGGTVSLLNSMIWHNYGDDIIGEVTASFSNVGDYDYGGDNISSDPLFEYGYYLADDSPSAHTGSDAAANLGLAEKAKNVDGDTYGPTETVNMGWHYPEGGDRTYADIYVSPEGEDSNPGTGPGSGEAFRTLTKAFSLAVDGSRIHVAAGRYTHPDGATPGETFPLEIDKRKGVCVLGAGAEATVIDGEAISGTRLLGLSRAHRTTLENLTLTGGRIEHVDGPFGGGALLVEESWGVVLSGCIFEDNTFNHSHWSDQPPGPAIAAHGNTGLTVTNCVIRNNEGISSATRDTHVRGGGIYAQGNLTVRDTRFIGNIVRHASGDGDIGGQGGAVYFDGKLLDMKNARMVANHAQIAGGGLYIANGSAVLGNCTIAENTAGHTGGGIHNVEGTVSMTNTIVWANSRDDIAGPVAISHSNIGGHDHGGDNLSTDPLFEHGYFLAAGSPCIGTGDGTAGDHGLTDYTTRTDGASYADGTEPVSMGWHYLPGTVFDLTYTNIYVAPAPLGDDGNSGTQASEPFATLTHALATARDGSRIHLAPGTYSQATGETFPLTAPDKLGIEILGSGAGDTILDADGSGERVMDLDHMHRATVREVTMTHGHFGLIVSRRSLGVRIADCIISNNTTTSSRASGLAIKAEAHTDVIVERCILCDNASKDTGGGGTRYGRGGGITARGIMTVRNTQILDNEVWRASTGTAGQGGGVWASSVRSAPSHLRMKNVLIAGNSTVAGSGDGIHVSVADTVVDLMNVTVADNKPADGEGIRHVDGTVSITNSIVWNNGDEIVGDATVGYSLIGDGAVYAGEGNKAGNPLFIDAGAGDYRPQRGSPAIDAGMNQPWMRGQTDLGGDLPRVMKGIVDMGCYESIPLSGTIILFR